MSRTERDAKLLGYAGLVPFALGAALAWMPGVPRPAWGAILEWTLLYGAVILSFMGGARWGLAMLADRGGRGEVLSGLLAAVAPALIAWAAVVPPALLPVTPPSWMRFVIVAVAFVGLLVVDLRAIRAGEAPQWYAGLRKALTAGVVAALLLIVARLMLAPAP